MHCAHEFMHLGHRLAMWEDGKSNSKCKIVIFDCLIFQEQQFLAAILLGFYWVLRELFSRREGDSNVKLSSIRRGWRPQNVKQSSI